MGAKSQRLVSGSLVRSVRAVSTPLEATCQAEGAMTWKVNSALRSGCSKFAKTRRASAGSYWVYR